MLNCEFEGLSKCEMAVNNGSLYPGLEISYPMFSPPVHLTGKNIGYVFLFVCLREDIIVCSL